METWNDYYERVGEKPNSLIIGTLTDHDIIRGAALDLGAGNLRDARFVKASGFERVVAVDSNPDLASLDASGIELVVADIGTYEPEQGAFDFVFSCNTLFFIPLYSLTILFDTVKDALKPGGVFACNMLGHRDDWATGLKQGVDFVMPHDIERLSEGWKVLADGESRWYDKKGKYWHTWTLVLRKPE